MIRLLVVDDNEQNRYLLQTLLMGHGHEVVVAADGGEALAKAQDSPPDMIITDILMPGMDGYELCRQWKRDERLKEVPLVFYTATYTDPKDEELALSLGADAFIVKPQEPNVFLETIERVMAENRLGQLSPPRKPVMTETVYFKKYNEALIRKLEDKLMELESSNARLGREVAGRMRAEEEMRRLNRALRILGECNETIIRAADEVDLLDHVCRVIVEIGGYGLAWVGLAEDDESRQVRPAAWSAKEPGYIEGIRVTWDDTPQGRGPAGTAIQSGRIVFTRDTRSDPDFEPWRASAVKHGYLSVVALPLRTPERVLGALLIYAHEVDAFDADEVRLLMETANDLTYGIIALRTRAERNRAHAELEVLARFVEENPNPVLRIAKDGTLLYANRASAPVMAHESMDVGHVVPEKWHAWMAEALDAECSRESELECNGQIFFLSFTPIAESGYVNVYGRDITKRRKAEEVLRISEERHRTILATAMDGFWVVDTQGRLLEVNQTYCRMSGYSEQELLAMRTPDLEVNETEEFATAHMGKTMAQGEHRFESRHRRKDGTILDVEVGAQYKPGDSGCIVAFLHDITERKRAEEEKAKLEIQLRQAQKMESVGRLAGGVAHDFNNMLAVILGYTEVALDQMNPDQPLHADLQEVYKAGKRAADLTRQLLAFARRQVVAPEVLDLNEAVTGMLKMLRRLIGEDIEINLRPEANLWRVRIDPSQIDQILANLCVNARDAIADTGKITIGTENRTVDEHYCTGHADFVPGEYALLTVSDDGCGMDREMLARVFEPFFTTKEMGKGTGLGLATIYGIVRQNGGFINVYSEVGQGTIFRIYLPRHEDTADQRKTDGASEAPLRGHETILLAEDEPSFLKLTATTLEHQGYTVLAANTPGEAIRLAKEHGGDIDLLMTDVVMPEMNGRNLAQNILSLHPHIKCLFMSGYTTDIIAHKNVLDEGTHFIQKPFSIRDLSTKLRKVLDKK